MQLVSNICPHQKSIISTSNGSGNRVCPYHNWTFDINGEPITSGRTVHYCKNETPLHTEPVFEWNSLLFSIPVNFNIVEKFDTMVLMESRVDKVKASYKNIMDLFLDVDHIQSVHRGVYDLIGITDTNVQWSYHDNGSIQTVKQGAFWIAVYPYTMIEWQKGALFITVANPNDNNSDVCVFKYADANNINDWKTNEYVWEKAWAQDKQQAELITEFSQSNLEPQKIHFRNFLKTNGIY
jgi:phenylpropionate dioxygenase-like ring-hydroxylating dioxygenase large terminal subunit